MSNDHGWVKKRIAHATAMHPTVPDAVSTQIENLLTDKLSDIQLTSAERTSLARQLLHAMAPPPPGEEATE